MINNNLIIQEPCLYLFIYLFIYFGGGGLFKLYQWRKTENSYEWIFYIIVTLLRFNLDVS